MNIDGPKRPLPSLSVIMPALNEEKHISAAIGSVLNAFKKYSIDGEIVVVDDGSRDRTGEIAESFSSKGSPVKLLKHGTNKGIGKSFLDGADAACKEVVVMFPADNENNPADALSFFYLINDVDIIVPFIHNIERRDKWRRLVSASYRFIINMSFGINLNYTNGTTFYRKCIMDDIKVMSDGFFYQAELLIRLIRKGYLFCEVPNFLASSEKRRSKAMTLRSLLSVIRDYVKLVYEIHIRGIEMVKGVDSKDNISKLARGSVTFRKMSEHN